MSFLRRLRVVPGLGSSARLFSSPGGRARSSQSKMPPQQRERLADRQGELPRLRGGMAYSSQGSRPRPRMWFAVRYTNPSASDRPPAALHPSGSPSTHGDAGARGPSSTSSGLGDVRGEVWSTQHIISTQCEPVDHGTVRTTASVDVGDAVGFEQLGDAVGWVMPARLSSSGLLLHAAGCRPTRRPRLRAGPADHYDAVPVAQHDIARLDGDAAADDGKAQLAGPAAHARVGRDARETPGNRPPRCRRRRAPCRRNDRGTPLFLAIIASWSPTPAVAASRRRRDDHVARLSDTSAAMMARLSLARIRR